jgi:quinol monooxygenase YgiN
VTALQVIARYTIAAGREAEVLGLLPQLIEASRAEPGCLEFTGYRELSDDRDVILLERYESRAAFEAHRDTPHFRELALGRIIPLLDSRTVETYDLPQ